MTHVFNIFSVLAAATGTAETPTGSLAQPGLFGGLLEAFSARALAGLGVSLPQGAGAPGIASFGAAAASDEQPVPGPQPSGAAGESPLAPDSIPGIPGPALASLTTPWEASSEDGDGASNDTPLPGDGFRLGRLPGVREGARAELTLGSEKPTEWPAERPGNPAAPSGDPLARLLEAGRAQLSGERTPSLPLLPEQAAAQAREALLRVQDRIIQQRLQSEPQPSAIAGVQGDSRDRVGALTMAQLANAPEASLARNGKGHPDATAESRSAVWSTPEPKPTSGEVARAMLAQHDTVMASRSGTGTAGDPALDTLRLDPPAQTPAATRLSAAPLGSETFGATLSQTIGDAAHTYAKAEAAQMARAHPSLATEQVVVHLAQAVKEGLDRISIHLKPAVLGRIDVELNLHHDGRVQAVVMAERPETLDLLQR
ncbi:MAG TPA: flagellar hook-length control protein FliK, partial [Alphaproteobacteria bacterium]|nr:flagellar hook-length control protein FliK [Alphaproteobacteria bacterium]